MYMSGLFQGSQLTCATLTKETYDIYMSVTKLLFYLDDADITVKSNHLPLKEILRKAYSELHKVNNWEVEIEQHRIKFEYIKGIKHTLEDTMGRLVVIDPDTCQDLQPEGQEYRYCI